MSPASNTTPGHVHPIFAIDYSSQSQWHFIKAKSTTVKWVPPETCQCHVTAISGTETDNSSPSFMSLIHFDCIDTDTLVMYNKWDVRHMRCTTIEEQYRGIEIMTSDWGVYYSFPLSIAFKFHDTFINVIISFDKCLIINCRILSECCPMQPYWIWGNKAKQGKKQVSRAH